MEAADCMRYVLSRCPAFASRWQEHRASWGDHPTPGGLMLDLAAFGRYAADAIDRDDATELAAIAEVADRLVDWPSAYVADSGGLWVRWGPHKPLPW